MAREDASSTTSSETTTVSWGDIAGAPSIPDWIYNPRTWLAGVIVGWIFDLWGAVLGYIESVWSILADIPGVAIYEPIATAFGLPGEALQDIWRSIGDIAIDVSEAAGPFAPIVIVAVWLVPAVLGAATVYFLVGFIGTYLPLRAIPGLRRFV